MNDPHTFYHTQLSLQISIMQYGAIHCNVFCSICTCFFYCFQMILSQGFDFQDLILVFSFYMFYFYLFFWAIVSGRDYALKHVVKLLKQYQKSMGEVIFFFGYEKENYHMILRKLSLRYCYESVILFRFRFNCYRKIILQNDAFLLISSHNLFST